MFNIGNLLNKFKDLTPPNELIKNVATGSIKEVLKIEVPKKNIKISGNIIYLDATPALKSAVFTNKNSILKKISEKLNGKENIKDIR